MTTSESGPRVRVAAIIVEDGRLLLVRHRKDGAEYWLLPGGGVDYGETAAEALVRELREETSLDIRVGRLVMANDSIPPDRTRHILNLYFSAEVMGGTLRRGGDPRLAEVAFVAIEDVERLTLYPDIRDALLPALRAGLPNGALYLGNLWKDQ